MICGTNAGRPAMGAVTGFCRAVAGHGVAASGAAYGRSKQLTGKVTHERRIA